MAKSDPEFTTALTRLKDAHKNHPFKTGTEEDTFVHSIMIALLLPETKERHYRSQNSFIVTETWVIPLLGPKNLVIYTFVGSIEENRIYWSSTL